MCLTSPGSCTLGLSFCFLLTMTQAMMLARRMTTTTERLITRIRTKGDSGVRDSDSARKYLMKNSTLPLDKYQQLTWYDGQISSFEVEGSLPVGDEADVHPGVCLGDPGQLEAAEIFVVPLL